MDGAFQWVTVGTFEHSKLHIDTDLVIITITIIITRLARRVVTSPGEKTPHIPLLRNSHASRARTGWDCWVVTSTGE